MSEAFLKTTKGDPKALPTKADKQKAVDAATKAGTALAADRVDLVDEDDRGRLLARGLEQVPDPRRAHSDEHLHEVGAGDRHERHARFHQTTGQQRTLSKRRAAIRITYAVRFAADVERFGCFRLHLEGRFHRLDAAIELLDAELELRPAGACSSKSKRCFTVNRLPANIAVMVVRNSSIQAANPPGLSF